MTVNNYYHNIRHDMAAILIKNCDKKLEKAMGSTYSLEVWMEGKIKFQRGLSYPPIQCSISNERPMGKGYTMVYILDPRDNENHYLYNVVSFDDYENNGVQTGQWQIKDHEGIIENVVKGSKRGSLESGNGT